MPRNSNFIVNKWRMQSSNPNLYKLQSLCQLSYVHEFMRLLYFNLYKAFQINKNLRRHRITTRLN
jgi:23S rRNA pseudoU1915 N3-methylase RlmH